MDRAYHRAYHAVWRAANPDRVASYALKSKYGLTLEDYGLLLFAQGGGCAICGELNPSGKRLHVDHDHETLLVRGLLCFRCNSAIGNLRDSADFARRVLDYLEACSGDSDD